MNDILLRYADFDPCVKGVVTPLPSGDYLIIINARYNSESYREIFNHEVRHLLLGHHHQPGGTIAEIELHANDKTSLLQQIKAAEQAGLPPAAALFPEDPAPPPPPAQSPTPRTPLLQRLRQGQLTGVW